MYELDVNNLLKQVLDMRKDIINSEVLTKDQYSSKYNYLYTYSPTLFEMVYLNEEPYLNQLNLMISNIMKIKRKEISQETADKEIGEKLAEKYIYPYIDMEKELEKN